MVKKVAKKEYYGNESLDLALDYVEVRQVSLFTTTHLVVAVDSGYLRSEKWQKSNWSKTKRLLNKWAIM